MCYLWIKESDAKTFKAFLSGDEIEVGMYVNPTRQPFSADDQIEIFYGDETADAYRAEIKRKEFLQPFQESQKSWVKLSLIKV